MGESIKKNQITISYEKITSEYISEFGKESLLILSLLSRRYTIRCELTFSLHYLYNQLNIDGRNKVKKDDVIKCIEGMFCIKLEKNINNLIDIPYQSPKQQYLILTDEEVDCILNYGGRADIYGLFNTYVSIKRYVNKDTKTSYPAIIQLMDILNISSNNTIIKYIKILEDLNMIKCNRSDQYILVNGKLKKPNNEYEILM